MQIDSRLEASSHIVARAPITSVAYNTRRGEIVVCDGRTIRAWSHTAAHSKSRVEMTLPQKDMVGTHVIYNHRENQYLLVLQGLAIYILTADLQIVGSEKTEQVSILAAVFSPERQLLVTTGGDGSIKAFGIEVFHRTTSAGWQSVNRFRLRRSISSEYRWMKHVVLNEGDGHIIAAHETSVIVWDLNSGQTSSAPPLFRLHDLHTSRIRALAFIPRDKHLMTSGYDGTVKKWSMTASISLGRPILIESMQCHAKEVRSLACDSTGHLFFSCSDDMVVKMWNAERGIELDSHTPALFAASSLATYACPAPSHVLYSDASGSGRGEGVLLVLSGALLSVLRVKEPLLNFSTLSDRAMRAQLVRHGADGQPLPARERVVYALSENNALQLLRVDDGHMLSMIVPRVRFEAGGDEVEGAPSSAEAPLSRRPSGASQLTSFFASPAMGYLLTGSDSGTIDILDPVAGGRCVHTLADTDMTVRIAALAVVRAPPGWVCTRQRGRSAAGGVADAEVSSEPASGEALGETDARLRAFCIVTGSARGHISLWSAAQPDVSRTFAAHSVEVLALLPFSVSRSLSKDGSTSHRLYALDQHGADDESAEHAHAHAHAMLSVAKDGTVRLWDMHGLQCVPRGTFSTAASAPACVLLRPDGGVLVGFDDGSLELWNLLPSALGLIAEPLEGDGSSAQLASSSYVGKIATQSRSIDPHSEKISSLEKSHSGDRFLSASLDGTVLMWHLPTCTALKLFNFSGAVAQAFFCADDGSFMAVVGASILLVSREQVKHARDALPVHDTHELPDGADGDEAVAELALPAEGALRSKRGHHAAHRGGHGLDAPSDVSAAHDAPQAVGARGPHDAPESELDYVDGSATGRRVEEVRQGAARGQPSVVLVETRRADGELEHTRSAALSGLASGCDEELLELIEISRRTALRRAAPAPPALQLSCTSGEEEEEEEDGELELNATVPIVTAALIGSAVKQQRQSIAPYPALRTRSLWVRAPSSKAEPVATALQRSRNAQKRALPALSVPVNRMPPPASTSPSHGLMAQPAATETPRAHGAKTADTSLRPPDASRTCTSSQPAEEAQPPVGGGAATVAPGADSYGSSCEQSHAHPALATTSVAPEPPAPAREAANGEDSERRQQAGTRAHVEQSAEASPRSPVVPAASILPAIDDDVDAVMALDGEIMDRINTSEDSSSAEDSGAEAERDSVSFSRPPASDATEHNAQLIRRHYASLHFSSIGSQDASRSRCDARGRMLAASPSDSRPAASPPRAELAGSLGRGPRALVGALRPRSNAHFRTESAETIALEVRAPEGSAPLEPSTAPSCPLLSSAIDSGELAPRSRGGSQLVGGGACSTPARRPRGALSSALAPSVRPQTSSAQARDTFASARRPGSARPAPSARPASSHVLQLEFPSDVFSLPAASRSMGSHPLALLMARQRDPSSRGRAGSAASGADAQLSAIHLVGHDRMEGSSFVEQLVPPDAAIASTPLAGDQRVETDPRTDASEACDASERADSIAARSGGDRGCNDVASDVSTPGAFPLASASASGDVDHRAAAGGERASEEVDPPSSPDLSAQDARGCSAAAATCAQATPVVGTVTCGSGEHTADSHPPLSEQHNESPMLVTQAAALLASSAHANDGGDCDVQPAALTPAAEMLAPAVELLAPELLSAAAEVAPVAAPLFAEQPILAVDEIAADKSHEQQRGASNRAPDGRGTDDTVAGTPDGSLFFISEEARRTTSGRVALVDGDWSAATSNGPNLLFSVVLYGYERARGKAIAAAASDLAGVALAKPDLARSGTGGAIAQSAASARARPASVTVRAGTRERANQRAKSFKRESQQGSAPHLAVEAYPAASRRSDAAVQACAAKSLASDDSASVPATAAPSTIAAATPDAAPQGAEEVELLEQAARVAAEIEAEELLAQAHAAGADRDRAFYEAQSTLPVTLDEDKALALTAQLPIVFQGLASLGVGHTSSLYDGARRQEPETTDGSRLVQESSGGSHGTLHHGGLDGWAEGEASAIQADASASPSGERPPAIPPHGWGGTASEIVQSALESSFQATGRQSRNAPTEDVRALRRQLHADGQLLVNGGDADDDYTQPSSSKTGSSTSRGGLRVAQRPLDQERAVSSAVEHLSMQEHAMRPARRLLSPRTRHSARALLRDPTALQVSLRTGLRRTKSFSSVRTTAGLAPVRPPRPQSAAERPHAAYSVPLSVPEPRLDFGAREHLSDQPQPATVRGACVAPPASAAPKPRADPAMRVYFS
jgi:WD40 repeat protein